MGFLSGLLFEGGFVIPIYMRGFGFSLDLGRWGVFGVFIGMRGVRMIWYSSLHRGDLGVVHCS